MPSGKPGIAHIFCSSAAHARSSRWPTTACYACMYHASPHVAPARSCCLLQCEYRPTCLVRDQPASCTCAGSSMRVALSASCYPHYARLLTSTTCLLPPPTMLQTWPCPALRCLRPSTRPSAQARGCLRAAPGHLTYAQLKTLLPQHSVRWLRQQLAQVMQREALRASVTDAVEHLVRCAEVLLLGVAGLGDHAPAGRGGGLVGVGGGW